MTLRSAKIRIINVSITLGAIFLGLTCYLASEYMEKTRQQRLDHMRQSVQIARNTIEPILARYRAGEITKKTAMDRVRSIIRRMVYEDYTGKNYIFMSSYDGTMLVQPFEPEYEMQNMWDLKDSDGVYIIRSLVDTAKSEKGYGYLKYHYKKPNNNEPEEKISFVTGIPELECYIGTGRYMTDLRISQRFYILSTVSLSAVLLILLFILVRASMAEMRRQNLMLQRENESLRLAEKALKNSEGKFRELFEQSLTGFSLTRPNGDFVSVNPAFAGITGYTVEELLNLSFQDITPGKHRTDDRPYGDSTETGNYGPREKELLHKQGHRVQVRISGKIVERDGEKFLWSSMEDISALVEAEREKYKLEEKLRQSHKMEAIGTLAAGIAHDFNNILFPIMGHAEMLMEDSDEGSRLQNGLMKIYESGLRAKDLVKQILTFSRQEKNEYNPLKIQILVKEALKLIRATTPATIEIRQNIQKDLGPVKADPTQIHQIIMNLSSNACHAMVETGGVLEVALEGVEIGKEDLGLAGNTPGDYACLTITDNGKGMKKELIQNIFDPFFTTKEKGKGTGMGLSVVHGIVKNMGGFIRVKSEPDRGACFRVYLPLTENLPAGKMQGENGALRGGNESILLVDDEKSIIEMESLMLKRLGYKVTSRISSPEALEHFKAFPEKFDMIITDMAMPKLSGKSLASRAVKIRPGIPVLLLTGFSETMTVKEAGKYGIRDILLKPVNRKDLAGKIREILDSRSE